MKGLLIKDFKLMKLQKVFFIFVTVISIGLSITSNDISFIFGFMTCIFSLFTLSTINYDEFDNGNAFLFTLPITRKYYVIEKYILGIILGTCALFLSVCSSFIFGNMIRRVISGREIIFTAVMLVPIFLLFLAVTLPIQLKFGGDRSKIVIIGSIASLFIIGAAAIKIAHLLGIDIITFIRRFPSLNLSAWIIIIAAVSAVLLLISAKISISIMNQKEF